MRYTSVLMLACVVATAALAQTNSRAALAADSRAVDPTAAALIARMTDPLVSVDDRRAAEDALEKLPPADVLPALLPRATDDAAPRRVLDALGWRWEPQAEMGVAEILRDPAARDFTRREAANLLVKHGVGNYRDFIFECARYARERGDAQRWFHLVADCQQAKPEAVDARVVSWGFGVLHTAPAGASSGSDGTRYSLIQDLGRYIGEPFVSAAANPRVRQRTFGSVDHDPGAALDNAERWWTDIRARIAFEVAYGDPPMVRIGRDPVLPTDPNWNLVQAEIARITTTQDTSPTAMRLDECGRIRAPVAAAALFPGWSFYHFRCSMWSKPGHESERLSIALFPGQTLAVPPGGAPALRLRQEWLSDSFEALLVGNHVAIKDAADAKLVWSAFCGILQLGLGELPMTRASDTEWRLGLRTQDDVPIVLDGGVHFVTQTHFWRVLTDPTTGRICAAATAVETSAGRAESRR